MQAITFVNGTWQHGATPLMGSHDHAAWMGSVVFDGARAFEGVVPDLDLHCRRAVASARVLGMAPELRAEEIEDLARDGVRRFPASTALYIRPLFWGGDGALGLLPERCCFALTLFPAPLPDPVGFSACLSPVRRPAPDSAPTSAKASCHYPASTQAAADAKARGFETAVLLDQQGDVAEFAFANLFVVKDRVVLTPKPNGAFLDGITRRRVIGLLRGAGVTVVERRLSWSDVLGADELFSTGNYGKVLPATRIEGRAIEPGPIGAKARALYWDFAHATPRRVAAA